MIFNSLGSNYNLVYALRALFSFGNKKDLYVLENFISKKYGGKPLLFYKGREALTAALEFSKLEKNTEVAVNGFTCLAVLEAIKKSGLKPIPLDLEETGGLNFTAKTLKTALSTSKKIKAVIIQNTLGYPCDIENIENLCKENKLILIEDLAHCVGSKYEDGREAGTVGDFTVLSFSQDKIIDAISGGALVLRNEKYQEKNIKMTDYSPKLSDRFYPILTYKIRHLYSLGLGKPFHFILKKINFLSNIMDKSFYEFRKLPALHAKLAQLEFRKLNEQLNHRREISKVYAENLPESLFMFSKEKTQEVVRISSNLRFPVFVENRKRVLGSLKKEGIFLSDIWYVDVNSSCPNAVHDSKIILNLPTHKNVSEKDALRISKIISSCI